jgi:hypothetical protein
MRQQALDDKNKAQQLRKQQQACQQARNRYYYLKDSARIYQRDADGSRMYLSDEAADAAREQARRAMVSACGSRSSAPSRRLEVRDCRARNSCARRSADRRLASAVAWRFQNANWGTSAFARCVPLPWHGESLMAIEPRYRL